jgi:hypothetical protein
MPNLQARWTDNEASAVLPCEKAYRAGLLPNLFCDYPHGINHNNTYPTHDVSQLSFLWDIATIIVKNGTNRDCLSNLPTIRAMALQDS